MTVMCPDAGGIGGTFGIEQTHLTEHRIAVDEHLVLHPELIILQPAGTRNIDEQVAVFDQVTRCGFPRAMEFAIGTVAIDPAIIETKLGHHAAQITHIVGTIFANRLPDWVIGPRTGILQIPDIVSQTAKS